MSHLIHLWMLELKRLRWPLVIFGIVLAISGITVWLHCESGYVGNQRDWSRLLADSFPFLAGVWIATLILLGDPPNSAAAFWRTKPWSRHAFGLAKALFLLMAVVLPVASVSLVEAIWFGVSKPALGFEFVGGMVKMLLLLWVLVMAAACSSRASIVIGSLIIIISLIAVMPFFNHWALAVRFWEPMIELWKIAFYFAGHFSLPQRMSLPLPLAIHSVLLGSMALIMVVLHYEFRRRWAFAFLGGIVFLGMFQITPGSRVKESAAQGAVRPPAVKVVSAEVLPESTNIAGRSRLEVTFEVPKSNSHRAWIRAGNVTVYADGKPFSVTKGSIEWSYAWRKNPPEFLQARLGLDMGGEHPAARTATLQCDLPESVLEETETIRLEGTLLSRLHDFQQVSSFGITESGTFRDSQIVCRVIRNERESRLNKEPPPDPKPDDDGIGDGRNVFVAVVGFEDAPRPPAARIMVRISSSPWIQLHRRLRHRINDAIYPVDSIYPVLWVPETRSRLRTRRASWSGEHAHFEVASDVEETTLKAARVDVYRRSNVRDDVESFTNVSVRLERP